MVTLILECLDIRLIHFPQSIQSSVQHLSFRIRHKNMPTPLNARAQISLPL